MFELENEGIVRKVQPSPNEMYEMVDHKISLVEVMKYAIN